MATRSAVKTVYHIEDGAAEMYLIDANSAVARFPKEWSHTPWDKSGKEPVPVVEIPADWQDLKPTQRINLAISLGAKRAGLTAARADEVIEREAQTRARMAEAEAPPKAGAPGLED